MWNPFFNQYGVQGFNYNLAVIHDLLKDQIRHHTFRKDCDDDELVMKGAITEPGIAHFLI